ncbi:MAG: uroporphyrinogen-III synthase [Acidobacteriota bacterium]|nr:uroporphyrinogen-III synthase [Acidobacteriota bacterium]
MADRPRILLTRLEGRGERLQQQLEQRGFRVERIAILTTEFVDLTDWRRMDDPELMSGGWWAFTSVAAVQSVARSGALRSVLQRSSAPDVAAVGPATGNAVRGLLGVEPRVVADPTGGSQLARQVLAADASGPSVVWFRGARATDSLRKELDAAGRTCIERIVYAVNPTAGCVTAARCLRDGDVDLWIVASSASALAILAADAGIDEGERIASHTKIVAIGEATAATLRAVGRDVAAVPTGPTDEAIVETVAALFPC